MEVIIREKHRRAKCLPYCIISVNKNHFRFHCSESGTSHNMQVNSAVVLEGRL